MRTPADFMILVCGACGGEICNARIVSHRVNYTCSLPKGHEGMHFDKPKIARWETPTLPISETKP
jgi:hypothetical protein